MSKPFTKDQIDDIVCALKDEPNAARVAHDLGLCRQTVAIIAKRNNIKLTAGKEAQAQNVLQHKLTRQQKEEIRILLLNEAKPTRIARAYGVTRQAIYYLQKGMRQTPTP